MNEQSVGAALHGLAECLFEFRIGACIHDEDFHAEGLPGRPKRFGIGRIGVLRVDQHGDGRSLRIEQFQYAPPAYSCRTPNLASQMRTALPSMAWNTGSNSPGELLMTPSTSEVAACRSSASASCSRASASSRLHSSSWCSRSAGW